MVYFDSSKFCEKSVNEIKKKIRKQTSLETRELVIKFHEEGKSLRETAPVIDRSHNAVTEIIDKFKQSGRPKRLTAKEIRSLVRGPKFGEEKFKLPRCKHSVYSEARWGISDGMAASRVGNLVFIEGTMNKTSYTINLKENAPGSV